MASTQSSGFRETIPGPKVRVVAKIRGFSDPDTNFETSRTVDWVSVNTENSGEVTVSFKEQSSSRYSVDYCYNERDDNEVIYSREVKPLVSAAFEGINSTVIAHGARGSGKTQLVQGSLEKSGLAMLAISEFLSETEKNGKSIAVSFYEIDHQDHAADLLNLEQSPILVLEDNGRIQFKGLSQTPVKSIAEFQNLYITACSTHTVAPKKGFETAPKKGFEPAPKKEFEPARRSHLGLIVHVFEHNKSVNGLVSKMNFVDMAGYEDARKKSGDASGVAENNKINKSIYALLNVCQALSANESRVPFRESKLTRMLQDSLRGTSKVLLVSCLNPSFCQDTVYMLSLASRSCQRSHRTPIGSTMKTASSTRQTVNLDSTKKIASSARPIGTLDSSKKNASSLRQSVTLDSTKKNVSLVRQSVTLDSTKKNASLVRQSVTLDSTRKSANSVRQSKTLDSTRKSENSVRRTKTLDSTRKSENSETKTLDSAKKSTSSARQTVASVSVKKSASPAGQTVDSVSSKKSAISAMQFVTVRKNKIPKSVSASTNELPGSISHKSDEETCVVAMKSEMLGRKLFDEVSHSAAKAEKEIYIASVTNTSQPLLDNSLSEDGYHVELNSRVERIDSSLNASSEVELDSIVEKGTSFEDKEEMHVPCIINYSKDLSIENKGHNMNKENNNLMEDGDFSPPISSQLRELQSLVSSTPLCMQLPEEKFISPDDNQFSTITAEPRTFDTENLDVMNNKSFWETFNMHGYGMKNSTEVTEPTTLDVEIRDVMTAKSPLETFNMHGSEIKNSTEVIEDPTTLDVEIRDVMNAKSPLETYSTKVIIEDPTTLDVEIRDVMTAKSPLETFNMHGSGIKNPSEVIEEPRTPDINTQDVMNTQSHWETFNLHGSGMKNSTEVTEPRTPNFDIRDVMNTKSPWKTFNLHGSGMKNSLVKDYLRILNTAEKDELKKLKGIGEKRANYILELREESPEPFKSLDDLKDIGLSEKQIKGMMKKEVGELFN